MNYMDRIFLRADIQQVRSFLLRGVDGVTDPRSYMERIESAQNHFIDRLHEAFPDWMDFDEITGVLFEYVSVIEDVYMEIGLQTGAMLAAQVGQNLKTAFEGIESERFL